MNSISRRSALKFLGLSGALAVTVAACAPPPASPTPAGAKPSGASPAPTTAAKPATGAATSAPATGATSEIKVGMPAPLSGFLANAGTTAREGAQFGVDELNAKGGVNGRQINLIVVDDKTDPAESTQVVRRLIESDKVDVILNAASSTATLAHMEVTKANGPVEIGVLSTDPKVTQLDHPYMFVAAANNDQLGIAIADFAVKEKNYKTFGIMRLNEAYGQNIAKVFSDRATSNGATIAAEESYAPDAKDFKALLLKVADAKPDAIFLSGTANDSGLIVKQAQELGITLPMLGSNPLVAPQFASVAGSAAEGVLISTLYVSEGATRQKTKDFIQAFQAKLNHEPDVYAAHAYDIVYIIAEVMGKGANDTKAIADALRNLKGFEGVTGAISFEKNGAVKKPISIVEIKNGKPVFLKEVAS